MDTINKLEKKIVESISSAPTLNVDDIDNIINNNNAIVAELNQTLDKCI